MHCPYKFERMCGTYSMCDYIVSRLGKKGSRELSGFQSLQSPRLCEQMKKRLCYRFEAASLHPHNIRRDVAWCHRPGTAGMPHRTWAEDLFFGSGKDSQRRHQALKQTKSE